MRQRDRALTRSSHQWKPIQESVRIAWLSRFGSGSARALFARLSMLRAAVNIISVFIDCTRKVFVANMNYRELQERQIQWIQNSSTSFPHYPIFLICFSLSSVMRLHIFSSSSENTSTVSWLVEKTLFASVAAWHHNFYAAVTWSFRPDHI